MLRAQLQPLALAASVNHSHGGAVEPAARSRPNTTRPLRERVLVPLGVAIDAPEVVLETDLDHVELGKSLTVGNEKDNGCEADKQAHRFCVESAVVVNVVLLLIRDMIVAVG